MLLCLLFLTGVPALTPSPVSAGPRGGLTPGTDISLCLHPAQPVLKGWTSLGIAVPWSGIWVTGSEEHPFLAESLLGQ